MPSMHKLSAYRTTFEENNDRGSVTYIRTRIVAWEGDNVTLDSGGWLTVTTKRKMCQAANQFALRYCVYQRKGEWFVDIKRNNGELSAHPDRSYWLGLTIPFRDGMTFNKWTGEVVS